MSIHSLVKIYVHVVWGTLNRVRVMQGNQRELIYDHILQKMAKDNIISLKLNVQPEHIHILLQLPADQSIAQIVKTIKGESAHWINEQNLIPGKFIWQRGYGAFSVSESQLASVKSYIENQDEHHSRKSFQQEYEEWARKYGVWPE